MTLEYEDLNKNILVSCGKSILDVGCGVGRYYEWALKHGIKYVGADVDSEVLKKAVLTYRSTPDFNPDVFKLINGEDLSVFPDKSCDTIFLVEVIEHVHNLKALTKLMNECIRVGRKNIFITTPNCSDEKYLRQYGLIYSHYTFSTGQGMDFKVDASHQHHLRFTKNSLSDFLKTLKVTKFEVVEKKPIEILKTICYYKLWAEISI